MLALHFYIMNVIPYVAYMHIVFIKKLHRHEETSAPNLYNNIRFTC